MHCYSIRLVVIYLFCMSELLFVVCMVMYSRVFVYYLSTSASLFKQFLIVLLFCTVYGFSFFDDFISIC